MIETITQELAGTRARIVRDLTALDDARARAARQAAASRPPAEVQAEGGRGQRHPGAELAARPVGRGLSVRELPPAAPW